MGDGVRTCGCKRVRGQTGNQRVIVEKRFRQGGQGYRRRLQAQADGGALPDRRVRVGKPREDGLHGRRIGKAGQGARGPPARLRVGRTRETQQTGEAFGPQGGETGRGGLGTALVAGEQLGDRVGGVAHGGRQSPGGGTGRAFSATAIHFVPSSISITGISSRMGYLRRQSGSWHTSQASRTRTSRPS